MKGIEAALVALDRVQPMQLTINNKPSDPTPITFAPNIEAAKEQPAPVVNLQAGDVTVPATVVNVTMPDEIKIAAMPERVTTTEVERDAEGNITTTVQKEIDA